MNEETNPQAVLEYLSKALKSHVILPRDLAEKALACYYGAGLRAYEQEGSRIPSPHPVQIVKAPVPLASLDAPVVGRSAPVFSPTIPARDDEPKPRMPFRIRPWASGTSAATAASAEEASE